MSTIPAPHPLKRLRFTDGPAAICAVVLLPILIGLGALLLGRINLLPASIEHFFTGEGVADNIVQYSVGLAVEAGVLAWVLKRRGITLKGLGIRVAEPKWWLLALGLYILQIIVVAIVLAILQALSPALNLDEVQNVTPFGHQPWAVALSFVTTVLIAPAVEELLFRGVLFGSLRTRLPIWLAAILAASVFGLLHGQLNAMIYTFLLGLILIWLYQRSTSLLPGILLHTLNNLIAFYLLLHS